LSQKEQKEFLLEYGIDWALDELKNDYTMIESFLETIYEIELNKQEKIELMKKAVTRKKHRRRESCKL